MNLLKPCLPICLLIAGFAGCKTTNPPDEESPGPRPKSRYLSDVDPVYRELESVQRSVAMRPKSLPKINWTEESEQFSRELAKSLGWNPSEIAKVIGSVDKIGTRYEDISTWFLISALLRKTGQSAKAIGIGDSVGEIRRGTLAGPEVNAAAVHLRKSNERAIVFNYQLFRFVNEMVKLAIATIEIGEDQENVSLGVGLEVFKKRITRNPEIVLLFAQRVLHFLSLTDEGPNLPPSRLSAPLQTRLVEGAELFVMGHEYAHLHLGHRGTLAALPKGEAKSALSREVFSWKQEMEADSLGARIFTATTSDNPMDGLGRWGAPVFLIAFQIAEQAKAILEGRTEAAASATKEEVRLYRELLNGKVPADSGELTRRTHPPARLRAFTLAKLLAADSSDPAAPDNARVGLALMQNLDLLWQLVREDFIELHKKGIRLTDRKPNHELSRSDWFARGYLAWRKKRYAEGIPLLERALESPPEKDGVSPFSIYFTLAYCYSEVGRLREALSAFSEAIKREAGYSWSFHNRGWAHEQLGDFESALRDYKKAIELDGEEPRHRLRRAFCTLAQGKQDGVFQDLEQVIHSPRLRAVDAMNAAEVYLRIGRSTRSAQLMELLISRVPLGDGDLAICSFMLLCAKAAANESAPALEEKLDLLLRQQLEFDWSFEDIKRWIKRQQFSETRKARLLEWVLAFEAMKKDRQ